MPFSLLSGLRHLVRGEQDALLRGTRQQWRPDICE